MFNVKTAFDPPPPPPPPNALRNTKPLLKDESDPLFPVTAVETAAPPAPTTTV
jgi:hypothetical protein